MNNGLFITLEGGEGAGKSTLIQYMKEFFEEKEKEIILLREPGGTDFAEDIRNLFLKYDNLSSETEALLMNTARVDNIEKVITPNVEKGNIVISDRFSGSSLVYQGIRRDNLETVFEITRNVPMITILVDTPPEVGLKRIEENKRTTNRLDEIDLSEHQIIHEGYNQLGELFPEYYWDIVLDGRKTKEELKEDVEKHMTVILELLEEGKSINDIKMCLKSKRNRKLVKN